MLRALAPVLFLASCGPPVEPCMTFSGGGFSGGFGGGFGGAPGDRPAVHVVSLGRTRTVDLSFVPRACLPAGSTWAQGEVSSPSGRSTRIVAETVEERAAVVARVVLGPFDAPGVWQLKLFVEPAIALEQVPIYVVEELTDAGVVESFSRACAAPTRSLAGTTYCLPQPPELTVLAQRNGVSRLLPRTREVAAVGSIVWALETPADGRLTLNRYSEEADGGLTATTRPVELSTTSQIFNFVDEHEVLLSTDRVRHDAGTLTRLQRARPSSTVFALVDRDREVTFGADQWCVNGQCSMLRNAFEALGFDARSVWFTDTGTNPVTFAPVDVLVQSQRPLGANLTESALPSFPDATAPAASRLFQAAVGGLPVVLTAGDDLILVETKDSGPVFRRLRGVLVRSTRDWLFVKDNEQDLRLRAVKVGP